MYGMIHQAAREMSLGVLGEEAWQAVLDKTGLEEEHFLSSRHYNDDVTLKLIGAISEVSGMPAPELLEAFGKFWIDFAANSSYGPVMEMCGDTLEEFLENLDRMHSSVKTTMPDASMPMFEVLPTEGPGIEVLYTSERDGLGPFVKGLLQGLSERFGESADVTWQDHAEGLVYSIKPQQAA